MPEQVERVPKDQVDLKILLVDGYHHNFLFPPSSTARTITQHIYDHWPTEWEERSSIKKTDNSQVLKLIYRGRFLGQTVTMSSLSIPAGKTTVLHMVIRDTIPENPSAGASSRPKSSSSPGSRCCTVL